MRGEREKLLHMEDVLAARVVGQDEAITVSQLHKASPVKIWGGGCHTAIFPNDYPG